MTRTVHVAYFSLPAEGFTGGVDEVELLSTVAGVDDMVCAVLRRLCTLPAGL